MDSKGRRILVVDDSKESLELLTEFMVREGYSVTTAGDGEETLRKIKAWKPHLVLLDINLPLSNGIELIPRIREITAEDYVAILLVSANMTLEDVSRGLDAGADDYLTKPFRAHDLLPRVRSMLRIKDLQDALQRARGRIDDLVTHDELTGLYNAKYFFRKTDEEISRVRHGCKPVSALLVDIDRLSNINGAHGFQFGNQLIREVGDEIRKWIRPTDTIARLGSDKFLVLLVEADLKEAALIAERIRSAVERTEFGGEKYKARASVSIGIAGLNRENPQGGSDDLIRYAGEALGAAKALGANRVEIYSFLSPGSFFDTN